MRALRINMTPFYYCLYLGTQPIKDSDGNETGEFEPLYGEDTMMLANVSAATGVSNVNAYGVSTPYDKIIVTDDMDCPINELAVLFVDKEPEYDESGHPLYDYVVKRVSKSFNTISYGIMKAGISQGAGNGEPW